MKLEALHVRGVVFILQDDAMKPRAPTIEQTHDIIDE